MRIATWNVNSLKARLERVEGWLERAAPDVLLIQETKLSDADAPVMAFAMAGYDLVHHGEGRWNGVAIATRRGIAVHDVITNFGDGPVRNSGAGSDVSQAEDDFDPFDEARFVAATVEAPGSGAAGSGSGSGAAGSGAAGSAAAGSGAAGSGAAGSAAAGSAAAGSATAGSGGGPVTVVSLYAPNGRVVGTGFYTGKLRWYERLARWLAETRDPAEPLVLGGDFNLAPADDDVWDAAAVHGGTHVSEPEREAFRALLAWGLVDAYRAHDAQPGRFTWWDYRAGNFHKNLGMRIDHLLATAPVAERVVSAEIDREARKGVPIPSDHAPVVIDLDAPGRSFDAGWDGALERIAARQGGARRPR